MLSFHHLTRLVVALFVVTLLGTGSSPAQSGFEIFQGADLPGSDYLVIEQGGYQNCVSACAADAQCRAFTFNVEKKVCFLKDNAGAPTRFTGAVSGRRSGARPMTETGAASQRIFTFEVFEDADLPGGDFDVLRNANLDQCQQACASRAECLAFTQNMEKNVCFLKSSSGQPQRFAGAVSGRKVTGPETTVAAAQPKGKLDGGFVLYANTDLPGGDGAIIDQNAGDLEACRLQCLFNDGCHAFTYNHNKGACLGKSRNHIGGDRLTPTPFKGATSGVKGTAQEVAAARKRYEDSGPKVPEADLAWREIDTAQSFVARIRAAAKPMGASCDAERAQMETIAASISAKLGKDAAIAGTSIDMEWKATPQEKSPPIWLMVSTDDPARFVSPGFYALMPGAIAPFGLAADSDRTRAMTTLFGKGALDKGALRITPLLAGELNVAVRAIGYLRACEEEFSREIATATLTISPSPTPIFQVRDPFSFDRPTKVWLSPDGVTKLEVFDGRFRLVDMLSGAFIADREGRHPNYAPTGRFVTFETGESGYEVIDTVDGAVLGSTHPSVIGWENNDSFLVEGWSGYGGVMAHSLLVSDASVGGQPSCRVCPGRDESYVLDLENDLVHDGEGKYAQRLSATRNSSKTPGDGNKATTRFVAEQTGAAPVYFPNRWNFRGGLKFVPYEQWVDTANGAEPSETQREETEHMVFAKELSTSTGVQLAGLQPVAIGQWRGAVSLDKPKVKGDALPLRLSELGLKLSPDIPPAFVKAKPCHMTPTEATNFLQPDIAARIVASVPAAKGSFVDSRDTHHCNPDGLAPNGQEQIFSIFDKAVQYKIGKRSIWLTIYMCAEGSAAFLYPNFHFFDSAYSKGFMRLDEDNPANDSGVSCDANIAHCNFDSRLYADRFLLIWSIESRALMLFDIDERKTIYKEFDLGRGDLLKEAFYSVEDQHITQVNTDGSFFVYDVVSKKRVMEGRYVDDETIAWTPDLRFDASPEGANYVNLRFPGQTGQYAFQQFARTVKRPGLVGEVLARRYTPTTQTLALPPRLSGDLTGRGDRVTGTVNASGAVEVRVYQDGLLTDTVGVQPHQADIPIDVKRIAGARWISLVAYDADGLASLPVGRDLAAAGSALPTVHALTVGIDRYSGAGLQSLGYANRDASTLLSAIEAQNGKSLQLGITAMLVDKAATPEAILASAEEMVTNAKKGETVVFSFAGHGVTGPDGRFYLATSETEAAKIADTALAWDRLAAVLSKSQARVIVFLDACHSGAAGTELFATNDDAVDDVLKGVPSGLLIFSASKGRQFSEESPATGGGLFTNAVADVIARDRAAHDLDGNGAIEISELYVGVKRKVSQQSEGRQVPWLARNEMVGDFAIF